MKVAAIKCKNVYGNVGEGEWHPFPKSDLFFWYCQSSQMLLGPCVLFLHMQESAKRKGWCCCAFRLTRGRQRNAIYFCRKHFLDSESSEGSLSCPNAKTSVIKPHPLIASLKLKVMLCRKKLSKIAGFMASLVYG